MVPRRVAPLLLGCVATFITLGCNPKPGTQLVVKGDLRPIERPSGALNAVADEERFYWVAGRDVRARSLVGGDEEELAKTYWIDNVALTKSSLALWADGPKTAVTLVPKRGGPARTVRVVPGSRATNGSDVSGLHGLDDDVLWTEGLTDPLIVAAHLQGPKNAGREVGRIRGQIRAIETRGSSFAVLVQGDDELRIELAETLGAPLRVVFHEPHRAEDEASITMKLGTGHVFLLRQPSSPLSKALVPLLAIPRTGGPVRVIEPAVCPHSLAVLGDDPVYLSARSMCPGEFPIAQKLEVRRYSIYGARADVLYSAFTGGLAFEAVGERTLLLDEHVPLPFPEGSAPQYSNRTARLRL